MTDSPVADPPAGPESVPTDTTPVDIGRPEWWIWPYAPGSDPEPRDEPGLLGARQP